VYMLSFLGLTFSPVFYFLDNGEIVLAFTPRERLCPQNTTKHTIHCRCPTPGPTK
jgi:hypothetical protein